jgi:hypothetical protein
MITLPRTQPSQSHKVTHQVTKLNENLESKGMKASTGLSDPVAGVVASPPKNNSGINICAIIGGCLGGTALVTGILVYYQYSVKQEKPLTVIDATLGKYLAENGTKQFELLGNIEDFIGEEFQDETDDEKKIRIEALRQLQQRFKIKSECDTEQDFSLHGVCNALLDAMAKPGANKKTMFDRSFHTFKNTDDTKMPRS